MGCARLVKTTTAPLPIAKQSGLIQIRAAFTDRGRLIEKETPTGHFQLRSGDSARSQVDQRILWSRNAHFPRTIMTAPLPITMSHSTRSEICRRRRCPWPNLCGKDDIARALADYDQAIQIDPTLAIAYSLRCNARITAGQDLQSALSDCNESLRLRPDQVPALNHRGFVHLKLGSVTQAMADFDAALAKTPSCVVALWTRSRQMKRATGRPPKRILCRHQNRSTSPGQSTNITARLRTRLVLRVWNASNRTTPVFVIARGNPDACGSGCNEWIAADGAFDQGAEKRFRNFLDTLKGRKLPIFFNSTGGDSTEAYAVGRILRERKMTASVGATIPDDCRTGKAMDAACRQLVQSRRDLKAELRTPGAICSSACVYALIGASVRQIPDGTRLGIHAPSRSSTQKVQLLRARDPADEQYHVARRRYVQQMGVDPELVDLADKTPHASIHILTRDEIARFRVETPQR